MKHVARVLVFAALWTLAQADRQVFAIPVDGESPPIICRAPTRRVCDENGECFCATPPRPVPPPAPLPQPPPPTPPPIGAPGGRSLAPIANVTEESGFAIATRAIGWRTVIGSVPTEHLAGTTGSSHLIHFFWSPTIGAWRGEDVTNQVGVGVAGELTAWVTPDGPYVVDHIAGRGIDNRLRVFYRSSRDSIWRVVDVTAITGRFIAGGLTSWQTPNGAQIVEHVAARDPSGRLLVFYWSPARDWQAVDVTSNTGSFISSAVTSWQVRRGSILNEYLAAQSTGGVLTVFSWSPQHDWQAQLTPVSAPDGAAPWVTSGTTEHLAAAAPDGTLNLLYRTAETAWSRVNVTDITGERILGRPTPYQLADGSETVELLGAINGAGHGLVFWWKPSRDWQALDLTDITGTAFAFPPESWLTPSGSGTRLVEHLAAMGPDGYLRVFYGYDQPRTLTDAVANQLGPIARKRYASQRVLLILWDPHYPEIPKPDAAAVDQIVFGTGQSVKSYFRENSASVFDILRVGTLGWYDAPLPLEFYDNPTTPRDKSGAAILAADPDFDFSLYDDNHDGTLQRNELSIVFIHPGGQDGLMRTAGSDREVKNLNGGRVVVDGVWIRECIEMGPGHPSLNLGVLAHEISHIALDLPDMYINNNFFSPTAAGQYSVMDEHSAGGHIDAYHKLKLGWAHPRLVFRTGRYTLPDVETRHRVYVLMNPARSTREYFLLENRFRGTSFDRNVFDQGIAVWHIMEEAAAFDASPPPPTVAALDWLKLGSGQSQFARKGIRMVRPILTRPFDDSTALWDGNDPAIAHDLSLRWGDGSPSGFQLHFVGSPALNTPLDVQVP